MRHVYRILLGLVFGIMLFAALVLFAAAIIALGMIPYIGYIVLSLIAACLGIYMLVGLFYSAWEVGDDIIRNHKARKARKEIEKNHIQ